jgi:hypothetical protein
MKTQNSNLNLDIFSDFTLSNEEMIYVRGGELDPIIKPTLPPIVI